MRCHFFFSVSSQVRCHLFWYISTEMYFHPHTTETRHRRWDATFFFLLHLKWDDTFFLYTSPEMSFHSQRDKELDISLLFFCYISSEMPPFFFYTHQVRCHLFLFFWYTSPELPFHLHATKTRHLRWDVSHFFFFCYIASEMSPFFFTSHFWDVTSPTRVQN